MATARTVSRSLAALLLAAALVPAAVAHAQPGDDWSVTRDQIVNRADATEKLVAILQAALVRPKPRRKTKPSRGARERRLGEKKRRGAIKSGRGKAAPD